ncbi:Hint domain-containing protein [Yoonia algicola]|uniref:Hint domain-containing protein n=1 Tax=Yoonia algicola TaxID=3137368 RepID=A0AAN0NHG0_9RHOB
MANYSYIGYDVGSIVFLPGSQVQLNAGYNPNVDRVVFNVQDAAGGLLRDGSIDDGLDFNGDRFADELGDDFTQLGQATSLDGSTEFADGIIYLEESYTLSAPGVDDIVVYRVEIRETGNTFGTHVGYITSEPLDAGVTYSFVASNVTVDNAPSSADPTALVDVPCFCAGTMIRTPTGDRTIESLEVGDEVVVASGETRTIRWIGDRIVLPPLADAKDLWPVRIPQNAFGEGLPYSDLLVSPNHRMMVAAPFNELHFGEPHVLVSAKFLIERNGIAQCTYLPQVHYYHMLFDTHQIVIANGTESESLYPGDMALNGMARETRDEILTIFPELATQEDGAYGPIAAPTIKRWEARLLDI